MRPGPPPIPAKTLQVGWRGVAVRSLGDPDWHREPEALLRVWNPRQLRVPGSAWVAAPGRPPGAKGICMSDSGGGGMGGVRRETLPLGPGRCRRWTPGGGSRRAGLQRGASWGPGEKLWQER